MSGRFDFPNHTQDETEYAVVYGYEARHFVDVEDAKSEVLPLARHLPLDAAFSIIYTLRQTAGVHDPDMEYAIVPESVIADTGTWMGRPDREHRSEDRWESIRNEQFHGGIDAG